MNQVWPLGRQPARGWPSDGDFVYSDEPTAQPARGQALSRTVYLSMDPYQWSRRRSGVEAVGNVCHGRTVSRVVESRAEGYAPGVHRAGRLVNAGVAAYTPLPRSHW